MARAQKDEEKMISDIRGRKEKDVSRKVGHYSPSQNQFMALRQ